MLNDNHHASDLEYTLAVCTIVLPLVHMCGRLLLLSGDHKNTSGWMAPLRYVNNFHIDHGQLELWTSKDF